MAEGEPVARLKDYPGTTPEGRTREAIHDFLVAVRIQIGVLRAEEVAGDTARPDEPWKSKWYEVHKPKN